MKKKIFDEKSRRQLFVYNLQNENLYNILELSQKYTVNLKINNSTNVSS